MPLLHLDHVNFLTNDVAATIHFYCDIIGLKLGNNVSIDTAKTLYFYIEGVPQAILHIGQASIEPDPKKFLRLAKMALNNNAHATGSFDHFCIAVDGKDYDHYINRLRENNIAYQTYCHEEISLKQIWMLDPNGVRVELNFIN